RKVPVDVSAAGRSGAGYGYSRGESVPSHHEAWDRYTAGGTGRAHDQRASGPVRRDSGKCRDIVGAARAITYIQVCKCCIFQLHVVGTKCALMFSEVRKKENEMLRTSNLAVILLGAALLSAPAFSQEDRPKEKSEVSVQAFGSFLKETTDNGIR